MLLNGVTPIPPERNTTGSERSFGNTNFPKGEVIFAVEPISKLASFFLKGVSRILVVIRITSSVGDEAM
jgi:hypothetical protein